MGAGEPEGESTSEGDSKGCLDLSLRETEVEVEVEEEGRVEVEGEEVEVEELEGRDRGGLFGFVGRVWKIKRKWGFGPKKEKKVRTKKGSEGGQEKKG